jgi:glyoxylase-like metal-dependent hydrolase (beta-lactamase superfamily II)
VTLEDHAGDIVAKARAALEVTAEEAAALAGSTADTYRQFEQTGQGSPPPRFDRLAARLGLHAKRLAAIASGWLPRPHELTRWHELRQITTTEGMAVNSYLVWDAATGEAALFDTGWEARSAFDVLGENGLELKHLFITHGHHDHVAALAPLQRRFPRAKVHSGPPLVPADPQSPAGDGIGIGGLRVMARPTPGHSEDGTSYLIQGWVGNAPPVVVVGDALFAGSMGGAAGAAFRAAKQAVREQILSLPPDTLICPGHGPMTTVGEEEAHNPFFA